MQTSSWIRRPHSLQVSGALCTEVVARQSGMSWIFEANHGDSVEMSALVVFGCS